MKKYILSIILLVLGFALLVIKFIIGSKINSEGVLIESFWMIPVGQLLVLTGFICFCSKN